MKMIAIIGASASGKSDLAFKIAKKYNGYILSLDSLSVYKEINIVSAKPTSKEIDEILHFGVDEIYPNESFSIMDFIGLYKKAKQKCLDDNKLLIIAGGSSFYLKSMIEGISVLPSLSNDIKEKAKLKSKNIEKAYEFLYKLDRKYMRHIKPNDRYRITRAFEIYLSTNATMSTYFEQNPRIKVIDNIDIYNLYIPKDELVENIQKRTKNMFHIGLLDEVRFLRDKYGDNISPMKSIGIKESISYLDNQISIEQLEQDINTNTTKLAKRQKTFNRTQLNTTDGNYQELFDIICKKLDE